MRKLISDEGRFWEKVDRRGADECWPWQAGTFQNGYGAFRLHGKLRKAHRVAFFFASGVFPEIGRHACDFKKCCNPRHVLNGTTQDNVADRQRRNRSARGEASGPSKLTTQQVLAILADPRTHVAIAKDYGVTSANIDSIKLRKTWRHLEATELRKAR